MTCEYCNNTGIEIIRDKEHLLECEHCDYYEKLAWWIKQTEEKK